ncbi:hypothetical protein POF50_028935 [Streptomyces sp. SL13]|jgi:hypothetical protein|uniref:Extradiol ring-cleavage dioxygenase LigAB LigA subunit domain-containing protein n=1 Tax=Streptantibioticus silvisoli TaxID=2705255 RepID=A0AA90H3A9_9ACTN|nr:hypothetical protein [Streptantibioticus silvisoli]MDI5961377.1 hypothetical protein [Streptantibioticus silvisoli]MDI5973323.1 hypothetical protein [Streptantibioticus silvisoli]
MLSRPGPGEVAGLLRTHRINEICHRVGRDTEFRARLARDAEAELRTLPLTGTERAQLLAGDVAALYANGAHPVLLVRLATFGLFGLDAETYGHRMAGAVRAPRHEESGNG